MQKQKQKQKQKEENGALNIKKVLIVVALRDFPRGNIANMEEPTKKEKYNSL